MDKRALLGIIVIVIMLAGCTQAASELPTVASDPAGTAAEGVTEGDSAIQPPEITIEIDETDETPSPVVFSPAIPDPETDGFTYTLPTGASPLRLSLPAEIEDIFYSDKTGLVGFGVHSGGHIEGLGHVWIELKPGTPVKSWAGGVVEDIRYQGNPGEGEYHIRINYGQNLIGSHMEIETPYVEVGDQVKRGQEIGMGCSFDPGQSSAEFALRDLGRTDGAGRPDEGVNVSPYDYLEDSEKGKLVEAYKKYVIEPYRQYGTTRGITWVFEPYQP